MDLGQRYIGSKGVRETRQEDGGLGNLASPGDREESASHQIYPSVVLRIRDVECHELLGKLGMSSVFPEDLMMIVLGTPLLVGGEGCEALSSRCTGAFVPHENYEKSRFLKSRESDLGCSGWV